MRREVCCPECGEALSRPRARLMPDGVLEYRCPACGYQIPMLVLGQFEGESCSHCGDSSGSRHTVREVDSSGLLNLVVCSACGRVLGRYWGLV